jgi:histone acetyltransferase (RNA polymerase elongator complex component)
MGVCCLPAPSPSSPTKQTHKHTITGTLHITLLTKGPYILPAHNAKTRRLLSHALRAKGVRVATGAEAAAIMQGGEEGGKGSLLLCTDGRKFGFDEVGGGMGWVGDGDGRGGE